MVTYKKACYRIWMACVVFVMLLIVACSPLSSSSTTKGTTKITPRTSTPTPTHIAYSCHLQQTPLHPSSLSIPEIQGVANHSELWALIESTTGVPPRAKSLVKIVWHMTGTGMLSLLALDAQGHQMLPDQGPAIHGGSNWNHPGDEWGSVFTFPTAGCWDLHATRDGASGDIWLTIAQ